MARGVFYWVPLVILVVVILGSASTIGVGIAYLSQANSWQRSPCSVDDVSTVMIVNSTCNSTNAFVVLLNSTNSTSIYLSDPVASYSQALLQANAVDTFNSSCWTQTTSLVFPAGIVGRMLQQALRRVAIE